MSAPLLELRDVRIDRDGRPLVESLSAVSTGNRIGLSAMGCAVIDALLGEAEVTSGECLLAGVELEHVAARCRIASARPWPRASERGASFTVTEGLCLSATLGGADRREAKRLAASALARLGLEALGRYRLGSRVGVEHYLAGLADAALFEPEILVLDWPIGQLSAAAWSRYGAAFGRLIEGRRLIVGLTGSARLPIESAWIASLDQVLHFDAELTAEVVSGQPSAARFLLVLEAGKDRAEPILLASGLKLVAGRLSERAAMARSVFVVELESDVEGRPITDPVLAACADHELPIVRLERFEIQC